MKEYLFFRKMLSPILLQILFWPAIGASIYYSAWLIWHGNRIGWAPLIVGTLFVRVLFEMLILRFMTYEKLRQIEQQMRLPQTRAEVDTNR
ncbi:MAG: hypothetical protein R3A44_33990 [Caldilineaceae bacterium]